MAVLLKTKSGKKLVPTVEEVSAGTAKKLEKYVPKTGGTFTGEIQIPQHSGDFVLADLRNTYPATEEQLGKAVNYTLLQVQNTYAKKDHGHTVATTSAAGFMSTQDKSKLDAVASTYLPLAGGTMTGELKAHNGLSLNSGTADFNGAMPYYLGIQSYAEGGKVFYRTAAEVKADLGINNKSDVGHTHSYLPLSGGTVNGTISHNNLLSAAYNTTQPNITPGFSVGNSDTTNTGVMTSWMTGRFQDTDNGYGITTKIGQYRDNKGPDAGFIIAQGWDGKFDTYWKFRRDGHTELPGTLRVNGGISAPYYHNLVSSSNELNLAGGFTGDLHVGYRDHVSTFLIRNGSDDYASLRFKTGNVIRNLIIDTECTAQSFDEGIRINSDTGWSTISLGTNRGTVQGGDTTKGIIIGRPQGADYLILTGHGNEDNDATRVRINRDGTLYEGGSRVYSANNKPSPADIGAAAASHTHSEYVDLSSAQTISGVKTFASEIKVGISDSSKGRITFSDSNYAFIQEAFQDSILINGSKGIFLRKTDTVAPSSKPTSSNYSTTNGVPAIGGYLSGTTLYLFTFGE